MLYNPNNKSADKKGKIGVVLFIVIIAFTVYIGYYQKKEKQINIRKSEISGIIIGYKDGGPRNGYYYYTNNKDRIEAYYFFKENIPNNLIVGDSIYKAPNSFRLYIYKKDEQGSFVFDRMVMKHNDSVSPRNFL